MGPLGDSYNARRWNTLGVETLHKHPWYPVERLGIGFHRSLRCTLKGVSVTNTDKRSSGRFHIQFAGSPLFVEATLS